MLDTGCSVSLIRAEYVKNLVVEKCKVSLTVMNCNEMEITGRVTLRKVVVGDSDIGPIEAHVLEKLPLGLDLIVGLDVIMREGLCISRSSEDMKRPVVKLGCQTAIDNVQCMDQQWGHSGVSCDSKVGNVGSHVSGSEVEVVIQDPDFETKFHDGDWVVGWRWKSGPPPLNDRRANYKVPDEDLKMFDAEIEEWISTGILVPWDLERDGTIRNVLPLMSVKQEKGEKVKVRPVLDFRFLNQYVVSHPGAATPLCQDRLREWRKLGSSCAIVDLKKAYLQIKVDPCLWCYQAVRWRNETFVLTRLGFGLNIAPKVMTKIVEHVLHSDQRIGSATSGYIDDIFVDESKVSVDSVVSHLESHGLVSKEPERLGDANSVRVLGLRVDRNFKWKRDGLLPVVPCGSLTRRGVHKLLGEWLGHFPVCGWLRVACGFLQRITAKEGIGWDDEVSESTKAKVFEISDRLRCGDDPVKGAWLVPIDGRAVVWTDASNIAIGVAVTVNDETIEDAAWLRKQNDTAHINISELDAAIRGINMITKWKIRDFTLRTDSATVCGWLKSVFYDSHNVKTRALSELIIRRRLDILRELKTQEELKVKVELVRSENNVADRLTRVPKSWLGNGNGTSVALHASATDLPTLGMDFHILDIHRRHHLGVDRTFELARKKLGDEVTRADVSRVLSTCDECAKICPAINPHYPKGKLSSDQAWKKVSSDITHYGRKVYLTVIDLGSRYCVWRLLRNETANEVCFQLNQLFSEFGPPEYFLSDNAPVYKSDRIQKLMLKWNVKQEFSCAYRPQGNGVSERNHRTIKTMTARSKNTIEECVFWYNVTSGPQKIPPYNLIFHSSSRLPGVKSCRTPECESVKNWMRKNDSDQRFVDDIRNPFVVGDTVYLRSDGKCDSEWSGPHTVTNILSEVSLEIDSDGVTRHVSHLKRVPRGIAVSDGDDSSSDSDSDMTNFNEDSSSHVSPVVSDSIEEPTYSGDSQPGRQNQRTSRTRRRPDYLIDYV